MAQLIFNIPDDQVDRVVAALARYYRYALQTAEMTAPPTQAEFVKQMIAREMKARVRQVERQDYAAQFAADDPGIEPA